MIQINEIFYSLQGEGQWIGRPNIFIRTTGCNLRCSYCDTTYAYTEGEPWKISKIIEYIPRYDCKKICITGGEPLIQPHIYDLIDRLIDASYQLLIETNGSLPIDDLVQYQNLIISMDVKCPSSKMHEKFHNDNMVLLREKDQIKYIIEDKEDYEFAKNHILTCEPKCEVFFQPVWNKNIEKIATWILRDNLSVRYGLQLHKILWGEKRQV